MKKHFILITGLSLLFFSCASKPSEDEGNIVLNLGKGSKGTEAINEIEAPEINTGDIGSLNGVGDIDKNSDSTADSLLNSSSTADTDTLNSTKDNSGDTLVQEEQIKSDSISDYDKELEALANPDVTDLEYVEEVTELVKQEPEAVIEENFELVPQEEVLAVTEKATEETANTANKKDTGKNKPQKTVVNSYDDDEIIDLTVTESPEDIIEILDADSDSTPEEMEPVIIIPSRKVTLKIGQTLEVMYPGAGWIYMGTTDSTKDFTFLGKKLGTQNTKFTFSAKSQGTKILHFFKSDSLTQDYIDDYLEVEITQYKDSSKATVPAPAYKQPVPVKKESVKPKAEVKNTEQQKNSAEQTATKTDVQKNQATAKPVESEPKNTSVTTSKYAATETKVAPVQNVSSEKNENSEIINEVKPAALSEQEVSDLLKQAHTLYENKDYKTALSKLSQFFEYSTRKRDEAYFLQGQIYEAGSTLKNIKLAIESYKNVTSNYPASPYWDDANKRIIYLTKFYLEGR